LQLRKLPRGKLIMRVLKPPPDFGLVFKIPVAKIALQIFFFGSDGTDIQYNQKYRNRQTQPDRTGESGNSCKKKQERKVHRVS
jgi:hypothetical protein